ncbi:PQQ-like beta-propeller repeat protein [Paracoccus ravus]|uniref:PQQ-like beta-propeller repeat protein n=1 Tax=Paracoccus ravus TaxID=2447760 RepID=UPI00106EBF95|nr:PQQ-like beta-propeller repeat protein [Paracoccus ravus]
MTRLPLIAAMTGLLALSACTQRDETLPGPRLDPRAVTSPDGPPVEGRLAGTTSALTLPPVQGNADWTQRSGRGTASGNMALGAGTTRIWSAPVGAASDRRGRITAEPIVAGGVVYTLDSQANLVATTAGGGRIWTRSLRPAGETGGSASGGGIAYEAGRVFATSGYGELVALDARSGAVLWRQRVEAPISGAPTVANGTVYVMGRNATGWAVRASDGRVMWRAFGNNAMAGVMGSAAPAVSGGTVVFPFATGQLQGVDAAEGTQIWSANVAGSRLGRSIGFFRDMTGDPVISGGTVYAGTSSGRVGAYDMASGAMKWEAPEGASSPPLVAGNSVFIVNDQAQLIRLDASNGGRVWAQKLPYFTETIVRKQGKVWNHYGPVLAGNRLYLAGSDGYLRVFDPATGALIGNAEIPGGAAAVPAVAGQTLYVVTHDGQLMAYR